MGEEGGGQCRRDILILKATFSEGKGGGEVEVLNFAML